MLRQDQIGAKGAIIFCLDRRSGERKTVGKKGGTEKPSSPRGGKELERGGNKKKETAWPEEKRGKS